MFMHARAHVITLALALGAGAALAAAPGPSAPTTTGPSAPPIAPAPMVSAAPVSMPPTTPPPPPPGGGNGWLVAVAVGGNCTFSVNGANKGTSSQLKLSVPAATYSVSCKPASGAQKTRSVVIKSGETAMAMFKLD